MEREKVGDLNGPNYSWVSNSKEILVDKMILITCFNLLKIRLILCLIYPEISFHSLFLDVNNGSCLMIYNGRILSEQHNLLYNSVFRLCF